MYKQHIGRFDLNLVSVRHTGNHYVPPIALAEKIESIWYTAKEKFGDKLWNGVNYRCEGIEREGDRSCFYFGTADYKANYASKALSEDIIKLANTDQPRCMYISSLLQTTDNKFILGQTAAAGIHGTTRALLGGVLNQNEMEINSGSDLESYLYKELVEEMEINRSMIISSCGLGVYEMPTCRIGIFLTTQLCLSSEEFRLQIKINEEHDDYAIFTREDILKEKENPDSNVNRAVFLALSQL